MVSKVLIANRGEIALRVLRACKELGIATVAVHSTADADAMHVRLADESVCIGPPPSRDSYLNIHQIVAACEITGADAVHPGYGFLSENAKFADILDAHGITFIGPTAEHIRLMGDKITAKQTAVELGIPVVPGSDGEVRPENAMEIARGIGFPVLIKATAGGGGRGMKVARTEADLDEAVSTARSEAAAAFGNDAVYMEKYLGKPRHIEVQIVGDGEGGVVHFGERDCTVQRRYQKLIEEAPASAVPDAVRARLHDAAVKLTSYARYRNAGTVEFLYDVDREDFYFIEVNSRIQVEHPVSEEITGQDLIALQLRVAAGEGIGLTQDRVRIDGHAIEVRINAEDPFNDFMPAPGRITAWNAPTGAGVRLDTHARLGYLVPPFYDSMIGKLIVKGADRAEAVERLLTALSGFTLEGPRTTLPLAAHIVAHPDFKQNRITTRWLEDKGLSGFGAA